MQQFTFADIARIATRLGLANTHGKVWEGLDLNNEYCRAVIHIHHQSDNIPKSIIKCHVSDMRFKDVDDMYDFLNNKKRRR